MSKFSKNGHTGTAQQEMDIPASRPTGQRKVKRIEKPSPSKGPKIRVERIKGGVTIKAVCVSKKPIGVQFHYDYKSKRSEGCYEPQEQCPGHAKKLPIKEAFYLHMWDAVLGQFFLELPPDATNKLNSLMAPFDSLRGQVLNFARTTKDNGRINVWGEPYCDTKRYKLPEEADPVESLEVLWALRRKPEA